MRLLYYLAAIGNINYDEKQNIFFKNINTIYDSLGESFDVIINMYDQDDSFINKISINKKINSYYIHSKKGVLVELLKTNPHNDKIKNYDYIIFILDDVLIQKFDIWEMIKIKEKYSIDIISPCIHNATHFRLMDNFQENTNLKITNAIEIYCIFVTSQIFLKYLNTHDIKNKWMWGHDFMLGYFGFTNAIYKNCDCSHMFPQHNFSFKNDARKMMMEFIKMHKFNDLNEITKLYPPIKQNLLVEINNTSESKSISKTPIKLIPKLTQKSMPKTPDKVMHKLISKTSKKLIPKPKPKTVIKLISKSTQTSKIK